MRLPHPQYCRPADKSPTPASVRTAVWIKKAAILPETISGSEGQKPGLGAECLNFPVFPDSKTCVSGPYPISYEEIAVSSYEHSLVFNHSCDIVHPCGNVRGPGSYRHNQCKKEKTIA